MINSDSNFRVFSRIKIGTFQKKNTLKDIVPRIGTSVRIVLRNYKKMWM